MQNNGIIGLAWPGQEGLSESSGWRGGTVLTRDRALHGDTAGIFLFSGNRSRKSAGGGGFNLHSLTSSKDCKHLSGPAGNEEFILQDGWLQFRGWGWRKNPPRNPGVYHSSLNFTGELLLYKEQDISSS